MGKTLVIQEFFMRHCHSLLILLMVQIKHRLDKERLSTSR